VLSAKELEQGVADGSIDTVIVAFTDMQGRLMGKRVQGSFFVDGDVTGHGVEGCNYLLALEMEMDPVPGYEIASWERGYGDFTVRPDMATLRRIPWLEGTALVLGDVEWPDGSPVNPSPRQVLKRQVERADRGREAGCLEHRLDLRPRRARDDGDLYLRGGVEHGPSPLHRDGRAVGRELAVALDLASDERRLGSPEPCRDDLGIREAGEPLVVLRFRDRLPGLGEELLEDRAEEGLVVRERAVEVEEEGADGHHAEHRIVR
jgi:hypothetical protein